MVIPRAFVSRTSFGLSRLVLGCGSFGGIGSAPAFFGLGETETQAFELMDRAWAAGIHAFDTADAYGGGRSEAYIGRWLRAKGSSVRDRLVLTSKVFHPVGPGPDERGLSRVHILRQIDASLARLQTDRLDLYLMHEWDPDVPLEETLHAFDDLVRTGKVRQVGMSNVTAEQVSRALDVSERRGWTTVSGVQNSFSLLDRSAERELIPACVARDVAFTAFSPLAGGWLTGKYRAGQPYPDGSRMTLRPEPYLHLSTERVFRGLAGLEAAARERGVAMSTLALAWVLAQPNVAAAVIGPRQPSHLEQALAACTVRLTPDEAARLAREF
jgi:aryl-alcohol dehydrogenase-like predicted oxidoreductase